MKKIIRLTESDLTRIVKRVIQEDKSKMSHSKDMPKNPLRKLERELSKAGHNSKLSVINLDFITIKRDDEEDLQVTVNDKGQCIVQPRSAKNEKDRVLLKTTQRHSGVFEDTLESGIDHVISFLKRRDKKKDGGFPEEYRPSHIKR
jgi:hypothetical protein